MEMMVCASLSYGDFRPTFPMETKWFKKRPFFDTFLNEENMNAEGINGYGNWFLILSFCVKNWGVCARNYGFCVKTGKFHWK